MVRCAARVRSQQQAHTAAVFALCGAVGAAAPDRRGRAKGATRPRRGVMTRAREKPMRPRLGRSRRGLIRGHSVAISSVRACRLASVSVAGCRFHPERAADR